MTTFAKILLYGILATVSARIGISIFYEIFPPESYSSINHSYAITATIVGVVCASFFLLLMVRSVTPNKKNNFWLKTLGWFISGFGRNKPLSSNRIKKSNQRH